MSPGPQGFYKGFEQGQKEKVTDEINQIKLEELKRDRDEMVQLQEKLKGLGQDPDVGKYLDAIAATGKPEYVKMAVEGRQKLKDLDAYAKLGVVEPAGTSPAMPTGAPAPVNALAPAPRAPGALGSGTFDPNAPAMPAAAPVPVNALAPAPMAAPAATVPVNALAPQPGADQIAPTQQRIRQLLNFARTNPGMATQAMAEAKILQDQLELYSKRGPTDSAEVQTMRAMGYPLTQAGYQAFRDAQQKAPAPASVPSMVGEYQFAKTPEGGGYVGSYEKFVRDRAVAARPPGTAAAPSAPVAVVDPVTGKQVYVSREQAISGKMSPAAAMESLPPKEVQKREAALPQSTSAVKGFEAKSDSFVNDLIKLRDHPGLEGITGAVYGRTGSVTKESSAAQALYDKVVAKGGFQALQDLRDASKTGGALGNVSNTEGNQLKASFAAIDRKQSAEDVKAAIDQAIADVQGAKTRMREAYDSTYSYKSGGAPSVAPAAANVVTHPQFPGFSVGKP